MSKKFNIWNKWDTLKTVMLGDHYRPEFFDGIKNQKIQSALKKISEETLEELDYFESVLKDFGCTVIRPELNESDNIMDYINHEGAIKSVPRSPLQPRDAQLIAGNKAFIIDNDHYGIEQSLLKYSNEVVSVRNLCLSEKLYNSIKCHVSGDWPSYKDYEINYQNESYFYPHVWQELKNIKDHSRLPITSANTFMTGLDIYVNNEDCIDEEDVEYFLGDDFRINYINLDGHADGNFHTIKPGAILSLCDIQNYKETFPNWDICYLPDQSWSKVSGFMDIKSKVKGKWWVPGEEDNNELIYFVETWLNNWVGYVEETVFDVNVLVLDEHNVCVSNLNPTVVKFLEKHNMNPIHIPWRHRYFWDGGLHCITLDLYRDGEQHNYFPERLEPINCRK